MQIRNNVKTLLASKQWHTYNMQTIIYLIFKLYFFSVFSVPPC
jgi:hypothetical protein